MDRDKYDYKMPSMRTLIESKHFGEVPFNVVYRPYLDAHADVSKLAADYEAKIVPVVQPAQAKAALDSLSNYAKVFHPAFVRSGGPLLEAAYTKLKGDAAPGKCFFRPRTSKTNELELVSLKGPCCESTPFL